MHSREVMKRFSLKLLCAVAVSLLGISALPRVVADSPTPTATTLTSVVAKDFRGFEMVYVPGGKFEMGISREALHKVCTTAAHGIKETNCDELVESIGRETGVFQTHTVELPSFWIDRYEVTIEQYQVCIKSGPGRACQSIDLSYQPKLIDNPRKPQLGVNWYDAVYFCNTRSARLPIEAEWEYAAKGVTGFLFPWGNTFVEEYAGPTDSTYPVGSILENKSWTGVSDLSGNAAEWVDTLARPYLSSPNWPQGFPIDDTNRVVRGGSWASRSFFLTTFYREFLPPNDQNQTVGFRCARTSDPHR